MPKHHVQQSHYLCTRLNDLVLVPLCTLVLRTLKVVHSIGSRPLQISPTVQLPLTPTPSHPRPGARRLVNRTVPTSMMGKGKAKATIPLLSKVKMTRKPMHLEQEQEEGEPELEESESEEEDESEEEEEEAEAEAEEIEVEQEMYRPTSSTLMPKSKGKQPTLKPVKSTSLQQRRSKRLQLAPPSPPPLPSSMRSVRQVPSRFTLPTLNRPSRSMTASGSGSGSSLTLTPVLTQASSSSRRSTRLSTPTLDTPMGTELDYTPPRPCQSFLKVEPVTSLSDLRTQT